MTLAARNLSSARYPRRELAGPTRSSIRAALDAALNAAPALDQATIRLYTQSGVQLPSIPQVAVALYDLLQDPDADIDATIELIESDPQIAGAILRCANSGAYFRGRSISAISEAVMRIGFREAACLALGLATRSVISRDMAPALQMVETRRETEWRRGLTIAKAGRSVSQSLTRGAKELVFAAGLFHTMGKSLSAYLLYHLERRNPELSQLDTHQKRIAIRRIRGILTGEYLLRENLPAELCRTCLAVSDPSPTCEDESVLMLRTVVGLAAMMFHDGEEQLVHADLAFASVKQLGFKRDTLDLVKHALVQADQDVGLLGR